MNKSKIIVVHAQDGIALFQQIKDRLGNMHAEISVELSLLPDTWEAVVILFVLTPQSMHDPLLINYAEIAAQHNLPLVPVVEDITSFGFRNIPESLEVLKTRNAVGLVNDIGPSLESTVAGYLGFASFGQDKKIFISYRRKDTFEQAQLLYNFFWERRYPAFMDTEQIEGGDVVQEVIMHNIQDKDFVLLLDSPNIESSPWVEKEITEALIRLIPVCAVHFDNKPHLRIISDIQAISWDQDDPRNMEKILLMASRAIAAKAALEKRLRRTLLEAIELKNLKVHNLEKRRLLLSKKRKRVLLEYEDAPITLERLFRLYHGKKEQTCQEAIFVCGDQRVYDITRQAVHWARGRHSLDVLPLMEFYQKLDRLFS